MRVKEKIMIKFKVTIGGPMIKRVTDDAREDEMEENLNQVSIWYDNIP